jgi:peptidoglycan/xylan/chitin deacetylase (PgdA/CDA1 family)
MRKNVRVWVAGFLYYSGLVAFFRWLMRRSGPRLIILNYHHSKGDLRHHLLYLRRHYRMLHLDEALGELYSERKNGQGNQRDRRDRRTPLVLTFDDGYHDNYTHAFKFANELQVPITIFLIPGYMDSRDFFWWGEGERLVKCAQVDQIILDERVYSLGQTADRSALTKVIDSRLRFARSVAEREAFLKMVRSLLAVQPANDTMGHDGDVPLSWAEAMKMQESGWVSFGAHTMHHPVLAYLDDPTEVRSEILSCREVLEQRLGKSIRTFAYPIGKTEHISDDAVDAVKESGYSWAVTTTRGVATPASDPYRLERVLGDASRHWLLMAAETSGLWHKLSPLWKPFIKDDE